MVVETFASELAGQQNHVEGRGLPSSGWCISLRARKSGLPETRCLPRQLVGSDERPAPVGRPWSDLPLTQQRLGDWNAGVTEERQANSGAAALNAPASHKRAGWFGRKRPDATGEDGIRHLLSTTIQPEVYLDKRVKQFTDWYNGKAAQAKKRYLAMRALSVALGALVPVLVNVQFRYVSTVTTTLSVTVVVLISLENVYHYREQWKNYRSTEQFLQQERFAFQTRVGEYEDLDDEQAFRTFVERVEAAIAAENASTLNTMTLTERASTDDSTTVQPGHPRPTKESRQNEDSIDRHSQGA